LGDIKMDNILTESNQKTDELEKLITDLKKNL
jgi:hypothetical protein